MIVSKNKAFNQFIQSLLKSGWRIERGKKHAKLLTPDDRLAAWVSFTPSDDKRGLLNLKSEIKRRLCGPQNKRNY